MAENQTDDSQKTEDPTQRRIEQAREKGQVARSQEVNHWFIILAMTLIVAIFAVPVARNIANSLYQFVARPHAIVTDSGQLRRVMMETLGDLGLAMLAPLALVMLAALVAGVIQNGLIISAESLTPKLEKISPRKGLKRLFSSKSLVDFVKGVAKITIVGVVLVVLLWPEFNMIPNIYDVYVAIPLRIATYALGQASAMGQFRERQGGEGRLRRWFDDDGASRRERGHKSHYPLACHMLHETTPAHFRPRRRLPSTTLLLIDVDQAFWPMPLFANLVRLQGVHQHKGHMITG